MRLFTILFLVAVSAEANKRRPGKKRTKLIEKSKANIEDGFNDGKLGREQPLLVPFGHIFREGVEDPTGDYKAAMDLAELDAIYLKDGSVARDLIKKQKTKFQVVGEQTIPRINLKDLYIDKKQYSEHTPKLEEPVVVENNVTFNPYFNMEGILRRNMEEPPKYRIGGGKRPLIPQAPAGPIDYRLAGGKRLLPTDDGDKSKYFSENSYGLASDSIKKKTNFTTCDDFGKRAKFHPNDIVNIDWVPFFIWTDDDNGKMKVSRVHRFQYPSKKLVKQYKDNLSPYLNKTIDWDQPKLLLKQNTLEFLLIAVGRTGLFDFLTYYSLPPTPEERAGIVVPVMTLRLKIVDPYLAMKFCDIEYTTIMAISGTEPRTYKSCVAEASILKFKGVGLPVRRDLEMEEEEARGPIIQARRHEQEKWIHLEDQMAAAGLA